jgi:hypothetical protein
MEQHQQKSLYAAELDCKPASNEPLDAVVDWWRMAWRTGHAPQQQSMLVSLVKRLFNAFRRRH